MSTTVEPIRLNPYTTGYGAMRDRMMEWELAGSSNKNLKQMAAISAHQEVMDNSNRKKYMALALAVPATDIFVNSALGGKSLSSKLAKATTSAGKWGGAFVALGTYFALTNKLAEDITPIKKLQEKHPIISAILHLSGGIATYVGAAFGLNKLAKSMSKKSPDLINSLKQTGEQVARTINKSKLNTNVIAPMNKQIDKFAKQFPTAMKTIKNVAPYAPFAVAAGLVGKMVVDYNKERGIAQDNYTALKELRNEARYNILSEFNASLSETNKNIVNNDENSSYR